MSWETVVGLETHVQLLTRSKMFSGASTEFGRPPNTQASAVDIALPGVLPVVNRAALEHAIRFGLAVNGTINRRSIFARKNYFYPDLPKGYQISQYELPIVQGGSLAITVGGTEKTIRLTRAHLEEDAGKSIHGEELSGIVGLGVVGHTTVGKPLADITGIDLNRAGTGLLEIVSEPDLRGASEAVTYARVLHRLVMWIGICDGNMQEGSFRCDANVSVRRPGEKLGTRCEIKNLNSFRFMEQAVQFEASRQIEILEAGGRIEQETRLYDPERNETRSMRTKEDAQDYRYFPDPDLLPLVLTEDFISDATKQFAKFGTPTMRKQTYARQYGSNLSVQDLEGLTQSRETAEYFEQVMHELERLGHGTSAKNAANFILGDLAAQLNENNLAISEAPVRPPAMAGLIALVLENKIPVSTAKKHFQEFWKQSSRTIGELRAAFEQMPTNKPHGDMTTMFIWPDPNLPAGSWSATSTATVSIANLWPISDAGSLEKVIDEVLAKNDRQVADYRAGKEKAFNSLVGQVMKATQGKANPAQVNELLRRKLKA